MGKRFGRNRKRKLQEKLATYEKIHQETSQRSMEWAGQADFYRRRVYDLLQEIREVFGEGTVFEEPENTNLDYLPVSIERYLPSNPLQPFNDLWTEKKVTQARITLYKLDVEAVKDFASRVYHATVRVGNRAASMRLSEREAYYLSKDAPALNKVCEQIGKRVAMELQRTVRKDLENG